MRHGLTAATVVPTIEDRLEFEEFEAGIRADYLPASTIEHELVARLASLLWRLRRSTLIETNLFELQGRLAMEEKLKGNATLENASPGIRILYQVLRNPDTILEASSDTTTPSNDAVERQVASDALSTRHNPATIFLRLCNLSSFPIERINRYETALWRQVAQTMFLLETFRKRYTPHNLESSISG